MFYVAVALVAGVITGLIVYLICVRKSEATKNEMVRVQADLDSQRKAVDELKKQGDEMWKVAKVQFENLAQEILEKDRKKLGEEGIQGMKGVTEPLEASIKNFRNRIEELNTQAEGRKTTLTTSIQNLLAQTNQVSADATHLADAIRGDAQMTGEWGEIQLRRILEGAGITEVGGGFSYQETFENRETGRTDKRTDFVINLTQGRRLIIDSKVTITGVSEYHDAKTAEQKADAENSIITSLKNHIDEIIEANYPTVVKGSLPVVLMYIPVDEVYLLAMKSKRTKGDKELLREYAARNQIAMVNSASVVPIVSLVERMWEVEKQEENTEKIVHAAEEVLRRCRAFEDAFREIGESLKSVMGSYETAQKKLIDAPNGQSIQKAVEKLEDLGVVFKTRQGKDPKIARAGAGQQ